MVLGSPNRRHATRTTRNELCTRNARTSLPMAVMSKCLVKWPVNQPLVVDLKGLITFIPKPSSRHDHWLFHPHSLITSGLFSVIFAIFPSQVLAFHEASPKKFFYILVHFLFYSELHYKSITFFFIIISLTVSFLDSSNFMSNLSSQIIL